MQRIKGRFFKNTIFIACVFNLMLSSLQAATPLWTFVPQTPTDITVAKGGSAQVIYTIYNQSSRAKTLVMKPITGVSQDTLCQLPTKGNCILTLNVNGSALLGNVMGGPVLCQLGNALQCYQPGATNILRIRLTEQPVQQFTIIPSAGANGSITPSTTQVVNAGSMLAFTATPNMGFGVDQWLLDGIVVQNGGLNYQLNNIQANHTVEVTFNQTTLSPSTQNLVLSINSPGADPALIGNPRIIQIQNTGSVSATGLQVTTSGLPAGTSITSNTCTGTLIPAGTCSITITPGGNASLDAGTNACTTTPGTLPVPTTVTVAADNALSTDIDVLVLGYGCIHRGGFLFSVDDSTPNTQSIAGKVAALTDEPSPLYQWATLFGGTAADSLTDGFGNSNALAAPVGQYPAAQICLDKIDQGFTDWYLPAICELGRFVGLGDDAGCGNLNANLYSTLDINGLGDFDNVLYWSSTEFAGNPNTLAWLQNFGNGSQFGGGKLSNNQVRCVRTFA